MSSNIEITTQQSVNSIPSIPENNGLGNKALIAASLSVTLISAISALSVAIILKYHPYHTAFSDSPTGGIRMIYSFCSTKTILITSSSIFVGFSTSGIATILIYIQDELAKRKGSLSIFDNENFLSEDEILAREIGEISSIALAVIFGVGFITSLCILAGLGVSTNLSYDVNINNSDLINHINETMKRSHSKCGHSWQTLMPNYFLNLKRSSIVDISFTEAINQVQSMKMLSNARAMYAVLIGYVGSLASVIPSIFLGLGLNDLNPNYKKRIKDCARKFDELPNKGALLEELKKRNYADLSDSKIRTLLVSNHLSLEEGRTLIENRILQKKAVLLAPYFPPELGNIINKLALE